MVNCCVPGFVNYSAKSNGISYHKLPRDTQRRKAWLEQTLFSRSFEVNLRAQITGVKCKWRLKEDAIPTEFCFRPPVKRPRPSRESSSTSKPPKSCILFIVLLQEKLFQSFSIKSSIRMRLTPTKIECV